MNAIEDLWKRDVVEAVASAQPCVSCGRKRHRDEGQTCMVCQRDAVASARPKVAIDAQGLRPDGSGSGRPEYGLDPNSRMVRRRQVKRPHHQWHAWIKPGHHDAAEEYLKAYERGMLDGRNMLDQPKETPKERFHESRSHWLHILHKAQEFLRPHERAVLDATVLAGMTLEAYAREVLGMEKAGKQDRISMTKGLLLGALASLCAHWRIPEEPKQKNAA